MSSKQIILLVCVVLMSINSASAKSWRGIEPLHSTRADVERLLGRPSNDNDPYTLIYDFPEERAFISFFSGEPCEEGLPRGWKLPKDTVLYIDISPTIPKKMEEVLMAGKEYEHFIDPHTSNIHYFDTEEGIRFIVSSGLVYEIAYYGPKEKDYQCAEDKYAAPIGPNLKRPTVAQMPFESFGKIRSDEVHARLDNYVIQLFDMKEKDPSWRGYIIVYAGRRSYRGEAQFMANCYKNYLVRVRKMDPGSLFAVDGGFREEFGVELYYGLDGYYPPILLPTVSPKKAQVVNRRLKSCSR